MDDTIVAIATPQGAGGIAIVRMSGPQSIQIAERVFAGRRKLPDAPSHTLSYGRVMDGEAAVDEVLVSVMRAPRSYTRQDVVEVNCHGGIVAARKTLDLLLAQGARLAKPGEFTQRAFLNGRIDLSQAEAVIDLVRARTEAAAAAAFSQLDGELSQTIADTRKALVDCLKLLEASLDFAEEEDIPILSPEEAVHTLSRARTDLDHLRASYDKGRLLRDGGRIVIVGKPNVGKSSLLNALLKQERAIVTPIPGTTRDSVEEWVDIDGIPCKLIDTAGIRDHKGQIETHGVQRTRKCLAEADLIVCVFDRSQALDREDEEVCREIAGGRVVAALNKCDLEQVAQSGPVEEWLGNVPLVQVSAKYGTGIGQLEEVLSQAGMQAAHAGNGVTITRARHKDCLDRAAAALKRGERALSERLSFEFAAEDVREALAALGEMTGETVREDVLNLIFEEFCIGK